MNSKSDETHRTSRPGSQTNPPIYSPMVERALRVAAQAHQCQKRKASDLPYFQHPASVTLMLSRCGFSSDEMLAAAALHDTLEDTDCTVESLSRSFPPEVIDLVQECSEQKKDASGTTIEWRTRKEVHIGRIRRASVAARAIVLADKLHNLASMTFDIDEGEELWGRFNAPARDVIWYHRQIVESALNSTPDQREQTSDDDQIRLNRLGSECSRLIDQLERSIDG